QLEQGPHLWAADRSRAGIDGRQDLRRHAVRQYAAGLAQIISGALPAARVDCPGERPGRSEKLRRGSQVARLESRPWAILTATAFRSPPARRFDDRRLSRRPIQT